MCDKKLWARSWTLTEARVVNEDYRCQSSHHRPHSNLVYQSPKRFTATTSVLHLRLQSLRPPLRCRWTNQGKQHNQ